MTYWMTVAAFANWVAFDLGEPQYSYKWYRRYLTG